ncbi:hypothetical protein ABK040_012886 [Willaertia magna]
MPEKETGSDSDELSPVNLKFNILEALKLHDNTMDDSPPSSPTAIPLRNNAGNGSTLNSPREREGRRRPRRNSGGSSNGSPLPSPREITCNMFPAEIINNSIDSINHTELITEIDIEGSKKVVTFNNECYVPISYAKQQVKDLLVRFSLTKEEFQKKIKEIEEHYKKVENDRVNQLKEFVNQYHQKYKIMEKKYRKAKESGSGEHQQIKDKLHELIILTKTYEEKIKKYEEKIETLNYEKETLSLNYKKQLEEWSEISQRKEKEKNLLQEENKALKQDNEKLKSLTQSEDNYKLLYNRLLLEYNELQTKLCNIEQNNVNNNKKQKELYEKSLEDERKKVEIISEEKNKIISEKQDEIKNLNERIKEMEIRHKTIQTIKEEELNQLQITFTKENEALKTEKDEILKESNKKATKLKEEISNLHKDLDSCKEIEINTNLLLENIIKEKKRLENDVKILKEENESLTLKVTSLEDSTKEQNMTSEQYLTQVIKLQEERKTTVDTLLSKINSLQEELRVSKDNYNEELTQTKEYKVLIFNLLHDFKSIIDIEITREVNDESVTIKNRLEEMADIKDKISYRLKMMTHKLQISDEKSRILGEELMNVTELLSIERDKFEKAKLEQEEINKNEITKLKQILKEKENIINELTSSKNDLQIQFIDQEKSINTRKEAFRNGLIEKIEEINYLRKETEEKIGLLNKQLKEEQLLTNNLKCVIEEKEKKEQQFCEEIKKLKEEYKMLETSFNTVSNEKLSFQHEIEKLENSVTELNEKIVEMKEKEAKQLELLEDKSLNDKSIEDLKKLMTFRNRELQMLKAENELWRSKEEANKEEMQKVYNAHEKVISDLKAKYNSLQYEYSLIVLGNVTEGETNVILKEKQETIDNLRLELKHLQETIISLKAALNKTEEKALYNTVPSQPQKLLIPESDEVIKLKLLLEREKIVSDNLRAENSSLVDKITQLQQNNHQLQLEMKELKKTLNELGSQAKTLIQRYSQKSKQVEQEEKAAGELREALNKALNIIKSNEETISFMKSTNEALKQENVILQERLQKR